MNEIAHKASRFALLLTYLNECSSVTRIRKHKWSDISLQLSLLQEIEKKLSINTPSDWYKIRNRDVIANGGRSLVNLYGGSLSKMLSAIYPEVHWDIKRLTINMCCH
jgi:hypothetical protein